METYVSLERMDIFLNNAERREHIVASAITIIRKPWRERELIVLLLLMFTN